MILIQFYNSADVCVRERLIDNKLVDTVAGATMLCDFVHAVLEAPTCAEYIATVRRDGKLIAHFPDFFADIWQGDHEALREYLANRIQKKPRIA